MYFLKSENNKPEVEKLQENHLLYEVGDTSSSVENRIANTENESTYLYGTDKICKETKVAKLNSEELETAIHHALANYQLYVDTSTT
ncbi:MAG: GIY-YIG nuclease family protein [Lactobacillaceae bacterium]